MRLKKNIFLRNLHVYHEIENDGLVMVGKSNEYWEFLVQDWCEKKSN